MSPSAARNNPYEVASLSGDRQRLSVAGEATVNPRRLEAWIGQSAEIQRVRTLALRYARSMAPVLITGESGTGKELVARYLHHNSPRMHEPFVAFNCAALSESLVESELFGHEKGAFTGAVDVHVGWFERAAGGTLLLDEISEVPARVQAKLLRVLEQDEFQRVGSNQSRPMRARILATSNRKLAKEIEQERFRADLYYRLNVLELDLPPLRQRRRDIPPLVDHFVQLFRHESSVALEGLHPFAMSYLMDFSWPGNVRQLRNTIRRACILAESPIITLQEIRAILAPTSDVECREADSASPHLSPSDDVRRLMTADGLGGSAHGPDFYAMPLRDVERTLIQAALSRHHGNRTAAARDLGVTVRTLHNRLRQDPGLAAVCDEPNLEEASPECAEE